MQNIIVTAKYLEVFDNRLVSSLEFIRSLHGIKSEIHPVECMDSSVNYFSLKGLGHLFVV